MSTRARASVAPCPSSRVELRCWHFEPGVIEGLIRGKALLRLHHEHALYEVRGEGTVVEGRAREVDLLRE